jgi:hypothetical protein
MQTDIIVQAILFAKKQEKYLLLLLQLGPVDPCVSI